MRTRNKTGAGRWSCGSPHVCRTNFPIWRLISAAAQGSQKLKGGSPKWFHVPKRNTRAVIPLRSLVFDKTLPPEQHVVARDRARRRRAGGANACRFRLSASGQPL